MDSKPSGSDWRSILLLIFSVGAALLAISGAIGMLILMAVSENFFSEAAPSPLATTLTATSLIAIGLLLLPMGWLSFKRLQGQEFKTISLSALRPWVWFALPAVWLLTLTLVTLFYNASGAHWYMPFLHFLAIAIPIYLVIHIAANHIPLGSSQRAWSVFACGVSLSPALAVIAEGIIILLGAIAVGLYLTGDPERMSEIERLVNQVQNAPDMDSMLLLLGPVLKNPLTLLAALTLLSVFVPIIEESFKSLGVWLVADRLGTPAQGFALGVLSGAGFALAESLFASATADASWAVTLGMRAISGAMHMLAAGLVGWGIAYARLEKRYLRLIGMTFLAMLLHGVWNAGAVFTIAGGVGVMLSMPDFDILGSIMMLAGTGLLFFLMTGMFLALILINIRLRTSPTTPLSEMHSDTDGVK
jgi:hypothetical protein